MQPGLDYRRFEASDLLPYATRETLEELGLVGYQIDTFSSDYDDYMSILLDILLGWCSGLCLIWPRCPRSGMLISGHCQPLAVSLSRPWSSMWPCVFVSVGTAISPVVLMWWTYRISCSRQVNIWICLIRSRRQMFLVIRLMRNWLKSR